MTSERLSALVAGIVCGAALCSPRTGYAQGPKNPCSPVTAAQVSAAVGAKLGPGEALAGSTVCQWATPPADATPVRVTLQFWGADAFAGMKTPLPGITTTPLAGVGEGAVYTTVGKLTTLSVKQGRAAFVVRIYGIPAQSKQKSAEKALALEVLAKL